MKLSKLNLYLGATISSWALAALVVATELYAPFKNILASTFTHHWIGKGVLTALVFILFSYLLRNRKKIGSYKDGEAAWYSAIGSLAVISIFYLIEFFA